MAKIALTRCSEPANSSDHPPGECAVQDQQSIYQRCHSCCFDIWCRCTRLTCGSWGSDRYVKVCGQLVDRRRCVAHCVHERASVAEPLSLEPAFSEAEGETQREVAGNLSANETVQSFSANVSDQAWPDDAVTHGHDWAMTCGSTYS